MKAEAPTVILTIPTMPPAKAHRVVVTTPTQPTMVEPHLVPRPIPRTPQLLSLRPPKPNLVCPCTLDLQLLWSELIACSLTTLPALTVVWRRNGRC